MDTKAKEQIEQAVGDWKNETRDVLLAYPFRRGDTIITSITLRYPGGAALSGIGLKSLLNEMQIDDIKKLLPRICSEITTADIKAENVHLADIMNIGGEIMLFFATPAQKAGLETALAAAEPSQTNSIN